MDQFLKLGDSSGGAPLPRKIAVVRALRGLGDFLVAVPALRALRAALPGAAISLIGLPSVRSLVQRFDAYLDHLVEFPGFPGIPEVPFDASAFKNWLSSQPARRFDFALQMHGNGMLMNSFVSMLGAPHTAGFYLPGFYCPDPNHYLPWPNNEPEVWRLLRLVELLGVPLQGDHLEFPLLPGDWESLAAVPESRDLAPRQYIVMHPGAYEPARRWQPQRFAALADELALRGFQVVLTGTAAEKEAAAAVVEYAHHPLLDLTGRTSLGALAVLLSQARLLVSNDTGVSHMAAALRVPSVIVFISSDPLRWAPKDRRLHRPVRSALVHGVDEPRRVNGHGPRAAAPAQCDRRCLRDACRCNAEERLEAPPSVDAVLAEAFTLLGEITYVA